MTVLDARCDFFKREIRKPAFSLAFCAILCEYAHIVVRKPANQAVHRCVVNSDIKSEGMIDLGPLYCAIHFMSQKTID